MTDHRLHRPRRAARVAATALALIVVAGCSSTADDPPTDSPSVADSPSAADSESATESASPSESASASGSDEPSGSAAPADDPFDRAAAQPLDDAGVVRVIADDDHVVTVSGRALVVRSVPDLEVAYTLEPEAGSLMDVWLPPGARTGLLLSAAPVAGKGTRVGRDDLSVQEFDQATGEVLKTTTVRLRRDAAGTVGSSVPRFKGRVGNTAVLDVTNGRGDTALHTAVAVDLAEGGILWRRRAQQVLTVSRKAVVVFRGSAATPGDVAGLSATTGRQRWAALPATKTVSVVGATADRVLLARSGPYGILAISAVDLRSGSSRPGRPVDTAAYACRPASDTVAVCLLPGRRLVGWGLTRNVELWSLPSKSRYAPAVTLVSEGRAYGNVGGSWVALAARTGEDVDGGPGPAPIAVNSAGGVFIDSGALTWVPFAA